MHAPKVKQMLPRQICSWFIAKTHILEIATMMWPPTGFLGSATKVIPAPGSDCTWLVRYTATLNSSATLVSRLSIWFSFCWRSESSPRPEKSVRNKAMMLSMTYSHIATKKIIGEERQNERPIVKKTKINHGRMTTSLPKVERCPFLPQNERQPQ